MKQASLPLSLNVKKTRKAEFLAQMERVVPWAEWVALIAPYYPEGKNGRPPFPLETMLRTHFLQLWFTLSDPAMEEAFFDVPLYREFAQLPEFTRLPDESTILRFRHRLEKHKLGEWVLSVVNGILSQRGLLLKTGTVVDVTLIAANCETSHLKDMKVVSVESTEQMQKALNSHFEDCNILIMSAAVADARPVQRSDEKIKKASLLNLDLESNPDLLAELAPRKGGRIMVGFAAETRDHLQEARRKLEAKGLDLIYVNDVTGGAIFGQDKTMGTILLRNDADIAVKEVSKDALGNLLLDQAIRQLG